MRAFLLVFITLTTFLVSFSESYSQTATQQFFLEENRIRQEFSFNGNETVVQLCNLIKGETYKVWAVQLGDCHPKAGVVGSGQMAATFSFVATGSCTDIRYSKGDGGCTGTVYISATCTSIKRPNKAAEKLAGISVAGGHPAESLIKDVFIGGGCFDITGVQEVGPGGGRGSFFDGGSSIFIDNGIILASGNITNALGPNNSNSAGNGLGGGGDADLAQLTTAGVFDAVGIEFNFVPTIASMEFQFSFASEEYCEYVNSAFNDVFGFFISGPGLSGPFSNSGINIATLPGGTPVTINNVNHLSNTGFFVPNQGNCGGYFNQNDIQYDGYTVVLTASATLIPCETYHIRLVVGDAGDGIFDSAVFLKANSFVAGNAVLADAIGNTTGTNLVYEPCNDGYFVFHRLGGDPSVPLTYTLTLDPNSTATPGVDYTPFPLSVTIPPGANYITIPINIFQDGIPEGIETIILSMENACSCFDTEVIMQIDDGSPIQPNLPQEDLCQGEVAFLDPAPSGGLSPYNFAWSNGNTDPAITVSPPAATNYSVTITDACGASAVTTTLVTVNPLPAATITGLGYLCQNNATPSVALKINFTGNAPWTFVYTIDGQTYPPITTSTNPYTLEATIPGTYELVSVTSATGDCEGPVFGVANVIPSFITVPTETLPYTCVAPGTVLAFPDGGLPLYNFNWEGGYPNSPVLNAVQPGIYNVTVTDANGCSATGSATVENIPPLELAVSATGVNCTNPTSGAIDLQPTGGSTPYTFDWSGTLPSIEDPTGVAAGTYFVTVVDNIGCVRFDTVTVTNNTNPPAATAMTNGSLTCTNLSAGVSGTGSASGTGITYLWSGPGVVSGGSTANAMVNQAGTYTLLVTNTANGCTSTASTVVTSDTSDPTAAATGDMISCSAAQVAINGNGSSTGANISYLWDGPGIVSGGTTLNPSVNAAGTYTLLVTNTLNGCTDEAQAIVTQDNSIPVATIAPPVQLNCNTSDQTLDASGSASGPSISYQWYTGGAPIAGQTSTNLGVNAPGTYQIVVSDSDNSCTASFSVTVNQNLAPPVITAQADGQITCTQTAVGLTGSVTGNPANYTFLWTTANGSITNGANAQNATAGTPGSYDLLVTNNTTGCTATASTTVAQDASIPTVVIGPADELNCTTTQLQLDGTASSQSPTLTYSWSTTDGSFLMGQNTLTPTVNGAGTYTLTIFDSNNNCESENNITISQDTEAPDASIAAVPVLDCATTSFNLDGTVSNFPASALNIAWTTSNGLIDGPANILDPATSTPGTYTLTVTNNDNGCQDIATVTVTENATPPVAIVANPDVLTCTNNTVTLSAGNSSSGPNFSYLWTTTDGNIVNGDNTLNPVVDQDGTYILTITNNVNHCTATEDATVMQNANVPTAEAGPVADFTCTTTQMTLNGSGSTGPQFSYLWTGPSVVNNATTLTPLIDQPGTYQLLITNLTNQCSATDNVVIGENLATPMAEAGNGGELSCTTTSMSLDGTGSSIGNVQYLWTSPNGNIVSGANSLTPVINAPGTYIIQVTNDINGCTTTDQVLISEDSSLPQVAIAQAAPITCNVTQVTLDGSNSQTGTGFTYTWSTALGNIVSGATTLNPVVNASGTYFLTVTNTATNCTNIGSVTVAQQTTPPAAEAGSGSQLTCTSPTMSLNGGGSSTGTNFSYLWTTTGGNIVSGGTTLTPTINAPGTYQILVTNATTGCTQTDQVVITQSAGVPTANATGLSQLTCTSLTSSVSGNGSTTGGNMSYSWTTTDGNILSGANTIIATVDEPGTYFLLVTNTSNGCTATDEAIVLQNTATPNVEAGTASNLTCTIETLTLDGNGSSTGTNFSYLWTTTNGSIASGSTTLTPTVNQIGTYTLTVTNSNNGCTASDNVMVNEDQSFPTATIAQPDMLTCATTLVNLQATASQGAAFEYAWTTAGGNIVSGNNTLNPEVSEPGIYTLLVTNTENGCTKEVQTTVGEDVVKPNADAGQTFTLDCFNTVNTLDGSGSTGNSAISYAWQTANGNIVNGTTTASPGVDKPGTYTLVVTNLANGCTDSDEVTITSNGPTALPSVVQPPCSGDKGAITISATGGTPPYLYSMDGGAVFGNDQIHPGLQPGVYNVVVQDAKGCEFDEDVTIQDPGIFQVKMVEPEIAIDFGDSVQIQTLINFPADEIGSISWNPSTWLSCDDCLDPIAKPDQTLLYRITVVTKNGCEDAASILVRVGKKGGVYVPNAFSPNGDGANDVLMIFTDQQSVAKVKSFIIFNRWGETMHEFFNFQPNDPFFGWDGSHRGQLLNPAVFAWFAEIEYVDGSTEIFKGDVTLMR